MLELIEASVLAQKAAYTATDEAKILWVEWLLEVDPDLAE